MSIIEAVTTSDSSDPSEKKCAKIAEEISMALSDILSKDSGYITEEYLMCIFVASFTNAFDSTQGREQLSWKAAVRGFCGGIGLNDGIQGEDRVLFLRKILTRHDHFQTMYRIMKETYGELDLNIVIDRSIDIHDVSLHTEYLFSKMSKLYKSISFSFVLKVDEG